MSMSKRLMFEELEAAFPVPSAQLAGSISEERRMDKFMLPYYEAGWYVTGTFDEPFFTWRYRLHGGDAEGGECLHYYITRNTDEEAA